MPQVDIKLVSTADTSGTDKIRGALDGVGKSATGAASGAGMFAGKMGEASLKAAAGKDVLEGLSLAAKGGEQSFFGASKALGAFMGVMNSAPAMAMVAGLGLAYAAFKLFTDRIVEAREKYRQFGEEINGTKDDYEALKSAAGQSLDAQIEKIKAASDSIKEYGDAIERAASRAKAIEDASSRLAAAKLSESEQNELSKAKTPEERASIKARYDEKRGQAKTEKEKNDLLNERLAAELDIKNSQGHISELNARKSEADSDVAVKQNAFDQASSAANEAMKTYGVGSPQHSRALKAANMAKAELDSALGNQSKITKEVDPQISSLESTIYDRNAKIEAGRIKSEAISTEERVAEKAKKNTLSMSTEEQAKRIEELQATAEKAAQSGDWAAQDKAVAELAKTKKDWAAKYGAEQPAPAPKGWGKVQTYAPGEDKGSAPGTPDLATPLNAAAEKVGASATQSADQIKAAAEAAAKVEAAAKPLDAAPLTSALATAATAQQAAATASAAALQSVIANVGQLTQIAQQQDKVIQSLRATISEQSQKIANLVARANSTV